jgi:hypothetical protein
MRSVLYSNVDITAVMSLSAEDIALPEDPSFIPLATRTAIHSVKSDIDLLGSQMTKSAEIAISKAEAKKTALHLISKKHVDTPAFDVLSKVASAAAKGRTKFAVVENGIALNWATMHPEKLSVVLSTSSDYAKLFVKLLEGLAGGEPYSAHHWVGDLATVYHTGSFADSDSASPVGLFLALSQLLADRGDIAASQKLHSALTKTVNVGAPDLKVMEFADKLAKSL